MQLSVEVQFCVNCYQHAWCSQHDEYKYLFHFEKIRQAVLQRVQLGDNILIEQMEPPRHYQKLNANPHDNKYFDIRRDEEVYFPRLGAFEVYVDQVLIFSKLRSNSWPNDEKVAEMIMEMHQFKREGKELFGFEVGYAKEGEDKNKLPKTNFRKRQLQAKTPQKDNDPRNNFSQDMKKSLNPDLLVENNELSVPNQRYAQQELSNPKEQDKKFIFNSINGADQINNQKNMKNYHQIYSSALHQMKELARKEKLKEKRNKLKRLQDNTVPETYGQRYPMVQQFKEQVVSPAKSKSKSKSKSIKQAVKQAVKEAMKQVVRQTAAKQAKAKEQQAAKEALESSPESKNKRRGHRVNESWDETKMPQPTRNGGKPFEKQLEDEWNLSDIIDPKQFNQQQKQKLLKKQSKGQANSETKIKEQKQKVETLLDALKRQQKAYMDKLEYYNQKLGVPIKQDNKNSMRTIQEEEPTERRKDQNNELPPIKADYNTIDVVGDRKKSEKQKNANVAPKTAAQKYRTIDKGERLDGSRQSDREENKSVQLNSSQSKGRRQLIDSNDNPRDNIVEPKRGNYLFDDRALQSGKKDQLKIIEVIKEEKRPKRLSAVKQVLDVSLGKQPEQIKSDKFLPELRRPKSKRKLLERQVFNETISFDLREQPKLKPKSISEMLEEEFDHDGKKQVKTKKLEELKQTNHKSELKEIKRVSSKTIGLIADENNQKPIVSPSKRTTIETAVQSEEVAKVIEPKVEAKPIASIVVETQTDEPLPKPKTTIVEETQTDLLKSVHKSVIVEQTQTDLMKSKHKQVVVIETQTDLVKSKHKQAVVIETQTDIPPLQIKPKIVNVDQQIQTERTKTEEIAKEKEKVNKKIQQPPKVDKKEVIQKIKTEEKAKIQPLQNKKEEVKQTPKQQKKVEIVEEKKVKTHTSEEKQKKIQQLAQKISEKHQKQEIKKVDPSKQLPKQTLPNNPKSEKTKTQEAKKQEPKVDKINSVVKSEQPVENKPKQEKVKAPAHTTQSKLMEKPIEASHQPTVQIAKPVEQLPKTDKKPEQLPAHKAQEISKEEKLKSLGQEEKPKHQIKEEKSKQIKQEAKIEPHKQQKPKQKDAQTIHEQSPPLTALTFQVKNHDIKDNKQISTEHKINQPSIMSHGEHDLIKQGSTKQPEKVGAYSSQQIEVHGKQSKPETKVAELKAVSPSEDSSTLKTQNKKDIKIKTEPKVKNQLDSQPIKVQHNVGQKQKQNKKDQLDVKAQMTSKLATEAKLKVKTEEKINQLPAPKIKTQSIPKDSIHAQLKKEEAEPIKVEKNKEGQKEQKQKQQKPKEEKVKDQKSTKIEHPLEQKLKQVKPIIEKPLEKPKQQKIKEQKLQKLKSQSKHEESQKNQDIKAEPNKSKIPEKVEIGTITEPTGKPNRQEKHQKDNSKGHNNSSNKDRDYDRGYDRRHNKEQQNDRHNERDRDHEKDYDRRDRHERHPDRDSRRNSDRQYDRDRDYDRNQDYDRDRRERDRNYDRERRQRRDRDYDRDRQYERDRGYDRDHDRDYDRHYDRDHHRGKRHESRDRDYHQSHSPYHYPHPYPPYPPYPFYPSHLEQSLLQSHLHPPQSTIQPVSQLAPQPPVHVEVKIDQINVKVDLKMLNEDEEKPMKLQLKSGVNDKQIQNAEIVSSPKKKKERPDSKILQKEKTNDSPKKSEIVERKKKVRTESNISPESPSKQQQSPKVSPKQSALGLNTPSKIDKQEKKEEKRQQKANLSSSSLPSLSRLNKSLLQKKPFQRITLSIDKSKLLNNFLDYFEYMDNKITKITGDGSWHCIRSKEILPTTGRYSFGVNIISSEMNCIQIGIMPQDYIPIQNKICDKSIGYHFANGKIHDTKGAKDKKTTSWRIVCNTAKKGKVAIIELEVDADNQTVQWKKNGKPFAESILTNYLKSKKCVAYISLVHKKDVIELNPKPVKFIERNNSELSETSRNGTPLKQLQIESKLSLEKSLSRLEMKSPRKSELQGENLAKTQNLHSNSELNLQKTQKVSMKTKQHNALSEKSEAKETDSKASPRQEITLSKQSTPKSQEKIQKVKKESPQGRQQTSKQKKETPKFNKIQPQQELKANTSLPAEVKLSQPSMKQEVKEVKQVKAKQAKTEAIVATEQKRQKTSQHAPSDERLNSALQSQPALISQTSLGNSPLKEKPSEIDTTQQEKKIERPSKIQEVIPRITLHAMTDKTLNVFYDNYVYQTNTIKKTTGDGAWHCIKLEQILPRVGKYSFGVNIISSEMNCIQIGIMPKDFIAIENKICDKSIGFHFANGKVHDTKGVKDKKTTSWRAVCQPTKKGAVGIIDVEVDADSQTIVWKMNGRPFAESILTNYLKAKKCVPYISMVHKNDTVQLNPEPAIRQSSKIKKSQLSPKKQQSQLIASENVKTEGSRVDVKLQIKSKTTEKSQSLQKMEKLSSQPNNVTTEPKAEVKRQTQTAEPKQQIKKEAITQQKPSTVPPIAPIKAESTSTPSAPANLPKQQNKQVTAQGGKQSLQSKILPKLQAAQFISLIKPEEPNGQQIKSGIQAPEKIPSGSNQSIAPKSSQTAPQNNQQSIASANKSISQVNPQPNQSIPPHIEGNQHIPQANPQIGEIKKQQTSISPPISSTQNVNSLSNPQPAPQANHSNSQSNPQASLNHPNVQTNIEPKSQNIPQTNSNNLALPATPSQGLNQNSPTHPT